MPEDIEDAKIVHKGIPELPSGYIHEVCRAFSKGAADSHQNLVGEPPEDTNLATAYAYGYALRKQAGSLMKGKK